MPTSWSKPPAAGRGCPCGSSELGYPQLDTEEVRVDVGYATRQYRVPVGALGSDLVVLSGPTPDVPRGGGASRVEGDRWLVTLMGVLGDHPPIDAGGFVRFASDLALPEIGELVREAEPLDDPVPHRHPVSRRHHYERRDQLPDGVVVLGDALCALNPIYGQGMTVAALQAEALRAHLSRTGPLDTRRYQRHASRIAGVAWGLATGADLTFPGVAGDRHIANRASQPLRGSRAGGRRGGPHGWPCLPPGHVARRPSTGPVPPAPAGPRGAWQLPEPR